MQDYAKFLESKSQLGTGSGFAPTFLPDWLIDFQASLTEWAVRNGRGAIFADCGLGKSPMELVWAENVLRKTGKPVLIMTPLAVTSQFVREGEKFGIECKRTKGGKVHQGINVTNYEQLHHYNPNDFGGAAGDESGGIKDFDSQRRKEVTEFFRRLPYRLLATATPAPNDFVELGNSSEALGDLGHMDMLSRFFKNDDKSIFLHGTKYGDMTQKQWRFKPHAEQSFWRWVCSWARACRKPSDLGFDDARFVLPELVTNEHTVKTRKPRPGSLYDLGANTLEEQREEQRRTIPERCEKVAELVNHTEPVVVWCHLNDEAELCERLIPGAIQVSGSDSDDRKEEVFTAFSAEQIRVLVTKGKIAGWGLNWQHCSHQTFFPSHSFEMFYQCVRRSWRFGQTKQVTIDVVTSPGAIGVLESLRRKSAAADRMFARLVEYMHRSQHVGRGAYGCEDVEVPAWLS